ncbi:MAG TPA: hypothetical protein DHV01_06380 [Rhodoferax sp.]|nr:hypothetical protein [Rhodoferax sp.]
MRANPLPSFLCYVAMFSWISTAQAGSAEIGDNINARIARAKSEQAARAAERASSKLADSEPSSTGSGAKTLGDGCTIAIGNVFEDDKKIGTSARRETTVIVTGDIIQAGNNCR